MKTNLTVVTSSIERNLRRIAQGEYPWLDEQKIRTEWVQLKRVIEKSQQDHSAELTQEEKILHELWLTARGFALGLSQGKKPTTWMRRGRDSKEKFFARLMRATQRFDPELTQLVERQGRSMNEYWQAYRRWERLHNLQERLNEKRLWENARRTRHLARVLRATTGKE